METTDIIKPENLVYKKPALLKDVAMHYCPGCSHSTVHKIICEVIEEMGAEEYAIGVAPVGCAVFAYNYIDVDMIEAGIIDPAEVVTNEITNAASVASLLLTTDALVVDEPEDKPKINPAM